MPKVQLGGTLKNAAGGETVFQVEGKNIQELLRNLGEAQPCLAPLLENGVAVSINGQIHRAALFQPVPEDAEVFLLPRLAGG